MTSDDTTPITDDITMYILGEGGALGDRGREQGGIWQTTSDDITTTSDDITKYKVPSFILGDVGRARRKTIPDACPWPRLAAV